MDTFFTIIVFAIIIIAVEVFLYWDSFREVESVEDFMSLVGQATIELFEKIANFIFQKVLLWLIIFSAVFCAVHYKEIFIFNRLLNP